jgi:hypothetical protein
LSRTRSDEIADYNHPSGDTNVNFFLAWGRAEQKPVRGLR